MAKQSSESTEKVYGSVEEQLSIMEEISAASSSISEKADVLQQRVLGFEL